LHIKCNRCHAAVITRSAWNCVWHLLTLVVSISETVQPTC